MLTFECVPPDNKSASLLLNHYNFVKIKTSTPTLNSKRQQDETLVYEHAKFSRDNQCDLERKPKLFSRKRSPGRAGLNNQNSNCSCSYDMSNYVTREEYNQVLLEQKTLWNVVERHEKHILELSNLKMNMELQMDWMKNLLTNHPDFCRVGSSPLRGSPNGTNSNSGNGINGETPSSTGGMMFINGGSLSGNGSSNGNGSTTGNGTEDSNESRNIYVNNSSTTKTTTTTTTTNKTTNNKEQFDRKIKSEP